MSQEEGVQMEYIQYALWGFCRLTWLSFWWPSGFWKPSSPHSTGMCPPSRTRGERGQRCTPPHTKHGPGAIPYGSKLLVSFHGDSEGSGERCSHPLWKPAQVVCFAAETQVKNILFFLTPAWNYLSYRENWLCSLKHELLPWSYEKGLRTFWSL